jgi:hypothetical protein
VRFIAVIACADEGRWIDLGGNREIV